MKIHWPKLVAALCLLGTLSFAVCAADSNTWRFSKKIKVTVSASETIRDSVNSYLNRELRSLNDVELVDNNGDWEISVLAVELKAGDGHKRGIALSTVIIQPFDNVPLSFLFQPKNKDIGMKYTSDLLYHPDHWLNVGATDDLQQLCKDIITKFDATQLEEDRKFFRQLKEHVQKPK